MTKKARIGGKVVVEVTDASFETEVLNSGLPCLVDFYAAWCAPCDELAPRLEELSGRFAGKVKFCRVDSDANRKLRIKFAVATLPYLVLVHDGKKTPLFDALVPTGQIAARLDAVLEAGSAPTTTPLRW